MRIKEITVSPAAVDADGIAQAQTPAGAGYLTLNGALGTTLDYARTLVLTTVADETSKTFTVVGTGANGEALTEVITGVNNTTALSVRYYKTITSIYVSGATTGAVTFGTSAATTSLQTQAIPLNYYDRVACTIHVHVTGTINYTVVECFDDILRNGVGDITDVNFHSLTALASQTTSLVASGTRGATAVRLRINSYSTGATAKLVLIPASNGEGEVG